MIGRVVRLFNALRFMARMVAAINNRTVIEGDVTSENVRNIAMDDNTEKENDAKYPATGIESALNVYSTTDGFYRGAKWNNKYIKGGNIESEAGLGYYASIKDTDENWHNYGHLDEKSVANNGLNVGDKIQEGTYLGEISTNEEEWGSSSGPHVHHEVWKQNGSGQWINIDPGKKNPLRGDSEQTAKWDKYDDGTYHAGRDFAPVKEIIEEIKRIRRE